MAEPFLGEIRMLAFDFAPEGFALCDGAVLPIAGNQALFALIGTTYGGDGVTTFALPDLRSRVPIHKGTLSGTTSNYFLGQKGGHETVSLTPDQLPVHTHTPVAAPTGSAASPQSNVWAGSAPLEYLTPPATTGQMAATALGSAGGGLDHDNMLPFLTINFVIALTGSTPQP